MLGIAKVIANLRNDVTYPGDPGGEVKRHQRPACPIVPGSKDPDWIPRVARAGWVIVTRDSAIQRHRALIGAVRQAGARMVALSGKEAKDNWTQLELVMTRWREIEGLQGLPGPFIYTATRTGPFRLVSLGVDGASLLVRLLTCLPATATSGRTRPAQREHRALHPHLHGGRCRRVGRRRARPGRRRLARVRRQWVGWQRLRWWGGRRERHRTSVCGGMEHECAAPAGVGPDLPAARGRSTGSGDPLARGDLLTVALAAADPRRMAPGGWHRICPRLGRRRGRRLACCQRRDPRRAGCWCRGLPVAAGRAGGPAGRRPI